MYHYFKTLANYNQWANSRLYTACAKLTRDEYMQERKAFFGSIHATLNHLLLVDRLWIGRVINQASGVTALDQILCADFDSLSHERHEQDKKIISIMSELNPEKMNDTVHYNTLNGQTGSMQLTWLLSHLFNHQTHHRGQVHGLLSQTEVSPPALDMYYFVLEE